MSPKMRPLYSAADYELLRRTSSDSVKSLSDLDYDEQFLQDSNHRWFLFHCVFCIGFPLRLTRLLISKVSPRQSQPLIRRVCCLIAILPCIVAVLLIFTAIFRPSYTYPPAHYNVLKSRCRDSQTPGRGNVNNETVFIAAALYDPNGTLVGGEWGRSVVELVQLLGPENVHLSMYENDEDDRGKDSFEDLRKQLNCNASLVSEHLRPEDFPHITIPTGEKRTKRIAFLAEVRNRALRPLFNNSVQFDRLLYINDVMFDPIDAAQLLFSTNIDTSGRAQYGAVCAVDFINAIKFYDRFATRDLEGYELGLPFYPWFTSAGDSASRQDVLEQKDAVRVRSCWGGMAAFEAKWFQNQAAHESVRGDTPDGDTSKVRLSPLRFRYELDPFWDASECCLVHADLTYLRHGRNSTTGTGIYTNPYVRVAYDSTTLRWLPYTRRVERLYPAIHNILNYFIGLPVNNPRRLEEPGDEVVEEVWEYEKDEDMSNPSEPGRPRKGSYQDVKRIPDPGRFCGRRKLSVLNDDAKEGEKKFISIPLPLPPKRDDD